MALRFSPSQGAAAFSLSAFIRGPQGPAATITVGTVTTGAAGSSATVTNVGTTDAAVLDFVIPRGDTGALNDLPNGAVGAPAVAWSSDSTSGIYRIAQYRYGYTFNGVLKYEMNATDFILPGNPTVNLGAASKQYVDNGFQPLDADLTALAGVTSAADALPYFTGSHTATVTTLSSFMRTVLDDASASAARTTLGVAIGTDVQAYDAQLSSLIRQNSQTAAYTTVLTDGGKQIYHPSSDNNARTFTIDSNANVAYPIGTAITFVNEINTVTIAITSDTLTLQGAGSTGSRTLAANGTATALKVAATKWIISGTGLT